MDLPTAPREELRRLEEALEAEREEDSSCALHFRVAQIYLGLGGDQPAARAAAIEHLQAAWRARPGDQDTLIVLADCLLHEGRHQDLAVLYTEAAEPRVNRAAADDHERARLLARAADLHRDGGRATDAARLYRRLLSLRDPQLDGLRRRAGAAAIDLLATHGEQLPQQRMEALSALVADLDADQAFDCELRIAELARCADLPEAVVAAYRRALALRPGAPAATGPLRAELQRQERFEELAELLASAATDPRATAQASGELWRELAVLREEQLRDLDGAAEAWWRAWRRHPGGVEANHLKRIYTEQERWTSYLDVLQREALSAGDADHKVDVYHELATLQREVLGDRREAAATCRALLQLRPDDVEALQAQVAICEELGLVDEAARALRRCARQTIDPRERDALLRRLARIELQRGQHGRLLRDLRQLSPLEDCNRELVVELAAACADQGQRTLGAKLEALLLTMGADDELIMELAQRHVAVGEPGQAADLYRQLLVRNPDHQEAGAALAAIERSMQPDQDPAATLAKQAGAAAAHGQPEQAIRLLVRAAQVAAHAGADEATIRGHLERAVQLCRPGSPDELRLIESALREAGMYRELVALLEEASEIPGDPATQRELLRALAQLLRHELDDPQRAVEVLSRALAIDDSDEQIAREVADLHRQRGHHSALAATLELLVARDEGNPDLLQELGSLYADHLGDEEAALRHYEALLALVPDHPRALAHCRATDERTENHRRMAVRLSRAVEVTTDAMQRAELHREIAQLAERRLGDLDFAVAHWRKVVEAFPGDAAPRSELKRLLTLAGHHEAVEAVLLSEVSRSIPEQKIPTYLELATLAEKRLRNSRSAAAYLRNALQLAPHNREVMARLETLHEASHQWRELSVILRRHAEAEPNLEAKVRLLLRAGRVLLVHLGRDEEALAVCRRVRELHPGERSSAGLMREIYARRQQWRQLSNLLREQINNESDPAELSQLHLDMGRLLLERIKDPEAAATHFELALDLDAGRGDVLPLLRRIYSTMGRWDLLTALIRRRAAAEDVSPTDRADALCEIGRIREEQQDDRDGAIEAYESAIHLVPDHRPALQALQALMIARGRFREAVTLARRQVSLAHDPIERARLLVEVAGILMTHLARPSAAVEALEEALASDPSHTAAAEQLARLFFDDQDWEKAGRLLEQLVNSGVDLDDIHEYHYRLGYACEQLDRDDDAFGHYVKSFGHEPMFLPTLNRLVDLCYQRRQWDNTLRIIEAIVDAYAAQKTAEELADLYLRYGLCKLHLAQRDVAIERLRILLLGPDELPRTDETAWADVAEWWAATPLERGLLERIDPDVVTQVIKAMDHALSQVSDHSGALQVLAALTICRGDWDRSLRYLERAIDSHRLERRNEALLLITAGDVAARHLHALPRAEGYYRSALLLLPASTLARQRLERLRAPASQQQRPAGELPDDGRQLSPDHRGAAGRRSDPPEPARQPGLPAPSRRALPAMPPPPASSAKSPAPAPPPPPVVSTAPRPNRLPATPGSAAATPPPPPAVPPPPPLRPAPSSRKKR